MGARSPKLAQVALCTAAIPSTVRRFVEGLGFADAGGDILWDESVARIQDLGDEVLCTVWRLCSRQSLFNLELFQHIVPTPNPPPHGRRPCDLGWARMGISVPDFEATLHRLRSSGIATLTEPMCFDGRRRVCFRDPDAGTIVEILEEGEGVAGGIQVKEFDVEPTVVYAALSVSDLDDTRRFFSEVVGLSEVEEDTLHTPDMEALWGLPNAVRTTAVFDGGGVYIEACAYTEPEPSPRPDGAQVIDHGLSHVALGFRDRRDLDQLADRLQADGRAFTLELGPPPAATYLYGPDRSAIEIFSLAQERDRDFGFAPRP